MADLGLFDLVGPYFLEGTDFGPALHPLLSALFVDEIDTAIDNDAVAIWGKARIDKQNLAVPSFAWGPTGLQPINLGGAETTHSSNYVPPKGQIFDLHDVTVDFRLTAPRLPAPIIANAQTLLTGDANLIAALGEFGGSNVAPSDYPGIQFRLDLLATVVTLHLPVLIPAKLDPSGLLLADPTFPDVKLILPKLLFTITQSSRDGTISVKLDSWGAETIDDPDDRGEGQLIQMVPPYALTGSPQFGFGFDKAILDLSDDHTPPEILSHFGAGDDWQGVYLPEVRVFVAPSGVEGYAFDVAARDLLLGIGDSRGISGDFEVDIVNQGSKPEIRVMLTVTATGEIITVNFDKGLGRVAVPRNTEMQLFVDINNGYPPYTIKATNDGNPITLTNQRGKINLADDALIEIKVTDSAPTPHESDVSFLAFMRADGASSGSPTTQLPGGDFVLVPDPAASNGKSIRISGSSDVDITLTFAPYDLGMTVTVDGAAMMLTTAGTLTLPRAGPDDRTIVAQWPASAASSDVSVTAWFHFDKPPVPAVAATAVPAPAFVSPAPPPVGTPESGYVFSQNPINVSPDEDVTSTTSSVPFARAFIASDQLANFTSQMPDGAAITIKSFSSYEHHDDLADYNLKLSQRRGVALAMLIAKALGGSGNRPTITVTPEGNTTGDPLLPDGQSARDRFGAGSTPAPGYRWSDYWRADAKYTLPSNGTATTITAHLRHPPPTTDKPEPRTAPPKQGNPGKPEFFHRIKFILRIAQDKFIAFEMNGEVDFQTEAENRLRDAAPPDNAHAGETPDLGQTTKLPGASQNPNPADGVTDFDLIISHDDAAGLWREQLTIGAAKSDKDGLWRWGEIPAAGASDPPVKFWRDVAGMFIVLAPLIDKTAAAVPSSGEEILPLVIEAGIPFALAAFDWVHTEAITLYGGELIVREHDTGTDAAFMFDVESALWLNVRLGSLTLLKCQPDKPVKVRYKSVGFKMNFPSNEKKPLLEPVFDSSKGFEINVTDPGTFKVPDPLGQIIQVLGARIARTNPLNIELDVGTSANLGVVSVDRAKVRLPLDPVGPPTITALGASINIPGTIKAKGYLDLSGSGVTGRLDLTIVPIKLRVAAGLSIQPIDGETGVLVTLEVDFPSPIALANSGLGLYGLLGLFAMHFRRIENAGGLPSPAMDWYVNIVHGDPTDVTRGWGPMPDQWAFGAGAVLGTLEGGTVLNLKGMLVYELPGPRLLFFMNANVLSFDGRPGLKKPTEQGKILATLDADFGRGTLSIGLAIDWKIDPLIHITVPADAFFDFNDSSNFAIDVGTYAHPAIVTVFKTFRADGYLEIHGNGITDVPPLGPIDGYAIALGLHVSLLWGKESIGLYLKAGASLDAGVGFSPFRLVGKIKIKGELHLFIVGIGASGELDVESDSNDTSVTGKICGEVDFFFFSVKGCVGFELGTSPPPAAAPPLVRGLYLQSRSPALVAGSGTDRAIDGSLGNATTVDQPAAPSVPIDSIPVVQFEFAPQLDPSFTSFAQSPLTAPNCPADGWCKRGEYFYRYAITSISLAGPPLLNDASGTPSVWRSRNAAPSGDDTSIDLGLLDWTPTATPNAVQSSVQLDEQIEHRWQHVCDRPAEPTSVLWTFQQSPLGTSHDGWDLMGTAWPDPPRTYRSTPPPLGLHVREAWRIGDPLLEALLPIEPGRVIGLNIPCTHPEPPIPRPPIPLPPHRAAALLPTFAASGPTAGLARLCPSRVLEAPFANDPPQPGGFTGRLVAEAETKIPYGDLGDAIVFEGQRLTQIRLLLLVPSDVLKFQKLVLRAFDEHDTALAETPIIGRIVSQKNELPVFWRTAGPWFGDVDLSWEFLSLATGAGTNAPQRYARVLADVALPAGTARVVLGIKDWPQMRKSLGLFAPSFLVAVIEGFPASEVHRHDYDVTVITDDQHRLEGALSGDPAKLPLFAPGSDYTITVQYIAEVGKLHGGNVQSLGAATVGTQALHFHTDDAAPARLDPWVLCIAPSDNEGYHFYLDPVIVVFATDAVTELYGAYGKQLRGKARAASFRPPASDPNAANTSAPVTPLVLVAGLIYSPWEEAVRALGPSIAACIDTSGDTVKHAKKEFSLFLDPLTSYVFDIETDPPPAIPDPPPDGFIVKPLYRTAFTTSRYPHVEAFAADVGASFIDHRPCASGAATAFAGLPSAPTDAQIDDVLRTAGLGTVARPKRPTITVLWETGGPNAIPFAVLIDAPEPLRRSRIEPTAVFGDPARPTRVTEWDLAPNVWLDVVEAVSGAPNVTRVLATPGGARVILQLAPTVVGQTLTAQVKRSGRKPIEDTDDDDMIPLFSVPLSRAPWEIGP